jgi:hypothetical protein
VANKKLDESQTEQASELGKAILNVIATPPESEEWTTDSACLAIPLVSDFVSDFASDFAISISEVT